MIRKGRNSRGEAHRNAKLTEAEVYEIRSDKWAGQSIDEIAAHFGITRAMISRIHRREAWAHLDPTQDAPHENMQVRGERCSLSKLTAQDVVAMRSDLYSGWRQVDIARHFGISQPQVSAILLRKVWAHV